MRKFKLSVHEYRQALITDEEKRYGYADIVVVEQRVQRYAEDRQRYKRRIAQGYFNPFTADPNCKSCGKRK